MCKEVFGNLTLKLLTLAALAVFLVDVQVLRKPFSEYFQLKNYLDEDPYNSCYKPQA